MANERELLCFFLLPFPFFFCLSVFEVSQTDGKHLFLRPSQKRVQPAFLTLDQYLWSLRPPPFDFSTIEDHVFLWLNPTVPDLWLKHLDSAQDGLAALAGAALMFGGSLQSET